MVAAILRVMTPFLLAAVGGLFSDLAGVLNIALEGLMLIGAFSAVAVAASTQSLAAGVIAAAASGAALAWIYGEVSLRLRANIFVAGIGTNVLAVGLTGVLAARLFGSRGVIRFSPFPKTTTVGDLFPILNATVVDLQLLIPVGWLCVALAWLVLYQTPLGLRFRSVGKDPLVASSAGLNPRAYQVGALVFSGAFCGLAGAVLALSLGAIVPGVTAGRGWIALVIVYLGRRNVAGILAASLLFGAAEVFSNASQGFMALPSELVLAFPYAVSLVALILASAISHRRESMGHAIRRDRE